MYRPSDVSVRVAVSVLAVASGGHLLAADQWSVLTSGQYDPVGVRDAIGTFYRQLNHTVQ